MIASGSNAAGSKVRFLYSTTLGGGGAGCAASKYFRMARPRGLPNLAPSRYSLGKRLSCRAVHIAREGGNNEDRANRRDPIEARPRAPRRHVPRPHHGGGRAGHDRQFSAFV